MKNVKQIEQITTHNYTVKILRTVRKKTASLTIKQGVASIVVPKSLAFDEIEQLVKEKHFWILDKISQHNAITPARIRQYVSGESFSYLGRNYRLKVISKGCSTPKLINGRITVYIDETPQPQHFIRKALVRWYEQKAMLKIHEKVERYQKVIGVQAQKIRIKQYKSRWGSCNAYGDLTFNTSIIMAPHSIIDYVVVHELCHLIHQNHSPAFWQTVERFMPNYKIAKDWLRHHGHSLII